jgi:AraC-like DNA-binding protein
VRLKICDMEFTYHAPPPVLSGSVKVIWCARGTRDEFASPDPIVPDGCVEMVFNLGDRFINAATGELQPRDLLAGQMTRPVVALPTGHVDLLGVRFHTARAGAALRVPMWELQDQLIAGSEVIRGLSDLVDWLREVPESQRVTCLAASLRSQLVITDCDLKIDHALALIDRAHGNIAVETIAKRVGISRRQLERLFREHVGLGVKHIARISRIHAVLDMLQQQPELSGAEIAVDCGYSDQAHLIRECQELAGQTPQRLKSTERSLAGLMREA